MTPTRRLTAAIFLMPFLCSCAQSVGAAVQGGMAALRAGYVVMDVDSGKWLARRRARDLFIPASVAKLATGLGVLLKIGPNARQSTRILCAGAIANGGLKGDLYLVGGGDPTFDHTAMGDLADNLIAQGVKNVEGRFLYDDRALPRIAKIEPTQPPDAPYNPSLSGLVADYGRYRVTYENGRAEGSQFPLDPLPVDAPEHRRRREMWLPVADSALFAARLFRWVAAGRGLILPRPQRAQSLPVNALEAARHDSPTVAEQLKKTLYYSNNIASEMIALDATGAPSLAAGADSLTETLKAQIPMPSWKGYRLPNNSGLSSKARMTPEQCASLVRFAATARLNGFAARDILPALETEPFGQRSDGPHARLRAKSGSLFYARGLAGIFRGGTSGKERAFCVFSDNHARRAAYDAIPFAARRRRENRSPAEKWMRIARDREKTLVLRWIKRF